MLLAAPDAGAVAAVHAGWRGTVAAIAAVGVRALVERGARAEDVQAALGPAIDGCCYEIEREIAERFANELGSDVWHAWRDGERPGKGFLDLRRVNALVLARAGVPARVDRARRPVHVLRRRTVRVVPPRRRARRAAAQLDRRARRVNAHAPRVLAGLPCGASTISSPCAARSR